jgi:hypothetical protein
MSRPQVDRSVLWQSFGIIIPLLLVHAIFRHIIHANGLAWLFAAVAVIGLWWLIWTLIGIFEDE